MSEDQVEHRLGPEDGSHREWNNRYEPAMTVESGSTIEFSCQDGSGGDIKPGMSARKAASKPFPGHLLTGPVSIKDAEPGDTLKIEILSVEHADWGYTLIRPRSEGRGLLPELVNRPHIHHWSLGEETGEFVNGIEVPLDPFPGVIGLSPAPRGQHSTIPPRQVGGNLDIRYLTEGSTLWLPVETEEALLSIGDGHAAQGDGEVCLTGIETPISVSVRVSIDSDYSIDYPQYQSQQTGQSEYRSFSTVGVSDSLMSAAEIAVDELVSYLCAEQDLNTQDAYILCSVAANLRINQVVNDPHYTVSAEIPESILI